MELRVENFPNPDDVLFIEERVREETLLVSGLGCDEELAVLAHEDGNLVGGCYGGTWGGTCELQSLWVEPRRRRRGLGRLLLAAAEEEALLRGCQQVVLFTHQLQAPGFYERSGYRVVGRVDDYPSGSPALWFQKRLRH
jgi:ribosomal protein S18 acetylase RimI-like enzyme